MCMCEERQARRTVHVRSVCVCVCVKYRDRDPETVLVESCLKL